MKPHGCNGSSHSTVSPFALLGHRYQRINNARTEIGLFLRRVFDKGHHSFGGLVRSGLADGKREKLVRAINVVEKHPISSGHFLCS